MASRHMARGSVTCGEITSSQPDSHLLGLLPISAVPAFYASPAQPA